MLKAICILITLILTLPVLSQDEKGTWTLDSIVARDSVPAGKSYIVFFFKGPGGKGVINDEVKVYVDEDTSIQLVSPQGKSQTLVTPGKRKITVCHPFMQGVEFTLNPVKPGTVTYLTVIFGSKANKMPTILFNYDKPVIYLYPEDTVAVDVRLEFKGVLGLTYPPCHSSWQVIAHPDGRLLHNGREYRYLFWEGTSANNFLPETNESGFLVNRDTLVSFLEKSLTILGYNSTEQQDFITYWVPQMQCYPVCFIHFAQNNACENFCNLKVHPRPNAVQRVFMMWTPEIPGGFQPNPPQPLKAFKREGFTVMEWGGTRYDGMIKPD